MTVSESLETSTFRVQITTTRELPFSAEAAWAVLSSTESYGEWNSFITDWTGEWTIGAQQTVRLQPTPDGGQTMKPVIVELEAGRVLAWKGRIALPGILDGHHRFEIEPIGPDRSRLVHSEVLSGVLVPMFRRMLTVDTPAAFHRMNAELEARLSA